MLVSWLAESEDDPDERVHEWLDGNGCDAWVLGLSGADPLDHAAGWNEHLSVDPDEMAASARQVDEYFEALGVGWITEGAVLMRKRRGRGPHIVRADPSDEDELEFASDQVERVFAALELIAESGDRGDPRRGADAREDVRFDQELDRSGDVREVRIALEEGTCAEVELPLEVAELLISLDGSTTLGRAIERTGAGLELSKREAAELRHDAVRVARDLFEQGFFELTRVRA